ncbi:type II toxin-antitoxin system HicB family antitoxin [Thauera sedimentorum]|uniref:type II toxin-antitoxin system HicB family antitoxin n=1 Tax=Thauera sedimentorum TaxID=2767595 RepID=UPI001CA7ACE5|nr:type II toxin-antitoxin system HicB family antitoxin [Thauera sedimentorum]
MERELRYVVVPEDGVFVACCLDVEIASDGVTERDAVANLQEALTLYFEGGDEVSRGGGYRLSLIGARSSCSN